MKARFAVLGMVVLWLLPVAGLNAAQLLFESFESYNLGILDANSPGDANAGTNGGPNPWWSPGQSVPSFRVVNAETNVSSFVTPHGGTNMIRSRLSNGVGPSDFDVELFNIAYRLNNSNAYSGNILLDYWFYDPVGTNNASQFQDYVSLAYFSDIPLDADYASDQGVGIEFQGLSLGAGDPTVANTNVYQAQVEGIGDNSYDGQGWFNTAAPRSLGWHHGRISVSPVGGSGIINVAFYIDNMSSATFTNFTRPGAGFNSIQLTAFNGNVGADYDDIRFFSNTTFGNTLSIATANNKAIVTFPDLWQLQTSTNLGAPNGWLTLTNAVSPYTNNLGDSQRYFRLKAL